MPLPVIATVTRAAVTLRHPAMLDPIVNVLHFEDAPRADVDSLDNSFQVNWRAFLDTFLPSTYSWIDVNYTPLDGGPSINKPWVESQPSAANTGLTPNAAVVCSWRTALAGRSHRGRNYISPPSFAFFNTASPDLVDPTSKADLLAAATSFISAMTSDTFPLVVASYKLASATAVLSAVINNKICTQRKRVNGR